MSTVSAADGILPVMKLDEADFMFRSFMVQATCQGAVIVSDLVTVIAAYHYIFNPWVNAHGCASQRCLPVQVRADDGVFAAD